MRRMKITDTTLRDAHQSLLATRMRLEEMYPILEKMNQVGYYSMEVWGGATFDSCMRFLDEDPWERLNKLRLKLKDTRLQMLLRGQNLLGYRHYPDDVVDKFVEYSIKNGIDIIRIFDALNDVRNMKKAIEATKEAGGHAQGGISYTISPVHDLDYFVGIATELKMMGVDSICIKDMAGLITPMNAYNLVFKLKNEVGLPVQIHCHYTSGMASMSYLKAIEAGVDIIDTATASLSLGTSQPPTDSMVAALQGTPHDTGMDIGLLSEISDYFKTVRANYNIPLDVVMGVDTNVLSYQVPGGMISNLVSQLEAQNASHLIGEVLKEVPRVRAELGYPPLVTPSSQIVGTQAVVNVLLGERYKMVSTEVKNYLKGLYGLPPGKIDEDLRSKVLGGENPITGRPADLLEPQMEKARKEIEPYLKKEEDILSYILFPNVALSFFKRRCGEEPPLGKEGREKKETAEAGKVSLDCIYGVDHDLIGSISGNLYYPA
ncbi:MAG: oxaloacetate decarboxylase subunit alpha [Firmicutes bacterium]|nr:oxaloacetate decarboxylase subunit alpha [Bacillota bacterium]